MQLLVQFVKKTYMYDEVWTNTIEEAWWAAPAQFAVLEKLPGCSKAQTFI